MTEVKAFEENKAHWITVSSDEYESMKSTLEVLNDNELLEQIRESEEDYMAGRYKKLRNLIEKD